MKTCHEHEAVKRRTVQALTPESSEEEETVPPGRWWLCWPDTASRHARRRRRGGDSTRPSHCSSVSKETPLKPRSKGKNGREQRPVEGKSKKRPASPQSVSRDDRRDLWRDIRGLRLNRLLLVSLVPIIVTVVMVVAAMPGERRCRVVTVFRKVFFGWVFPPLDSP